MWQEMEGSSPGRQIWVWAGESIIHGQGLFAHLEIDGSAGTVTPVSPALQLAQQGCAPAWHRAWEGPWQPQKVLEHLRAGLWAQEGAGSAASRAFGRRRCLQPLLSNPRPALAKGSPGHPQGCGEEPIPSGLINTCSRAPRDALAMATAPVAGAPASPEHPRQAARCHRGPAGPPGMEPAFGVSSRAPNSASEIKNQSDYSSP